MGEVSPVENKFGRAKLQCKYHANYINFDGTIRQEVIITVWKWKRILHCFFFALANRISSDFLELSVSFRFPSLIIWEGPKSWPPNLGPMCKHFLLSNFMRAARSVTVTDSSFHFIINTLSGRRDKKCTRGWFMVKMNLNSAFYRAILQQNAQIKDLQRKSILRGKK